MDHSATAGRRKDAALVKVVIDLDPSPWSDHAAERIWAEPVGPDVVVLRNVPFMAYGFSFEDRVPVEELEGDLVVREVVRPLDLSRLSRRRRRGGIGGACRSLEPLEEAGCSFEGATKRLLAVEIPAEGAIHRVYEGLEAGKAAGTWDFEEGPMATDRVGRLRCYRDAESAPTWRSGSGGSSAARRRCGGGRS